MPTKDSFDPAYPLPRFLAVQAERDTGNVGDGAATPSRVFKAGALIVAATATGIAVLAMADPAALLAKVSASLVDNASPPSTPAIQSAADAPALAPSAADAQALAPTTGDAPARAEIAASEQPGTDPAEDSESSPEALFRQFQAWAAEQDVQARDAPVPSAQDAPAQVVQKAPAPAAENASAPQRSAQRRRHVRAEHNARAEVRAENPRRQVRRAQSERRERPPVQDARAQDASAQNAEAPSRWSLFGLRN
ncbi:MAG TPA: hypothetical protein VJR30_26055 [Bradyrhizobium sp.]|nr:hypothetical protein [Bradyrhizobium sp.]